MGRMSETNTREAPVAQKAGGSNERNGFASVADVLSVSTTEALEKGIFGDLDAEAPEHVDGGGERPAQPEGQEAPDGPEATAGDGGDEPQGEPDEPGSDRFQARIDELTAQKGHFQEKARKLEQRLAELESKLEAPAQAEKPTARDPLADVTSQAELQQRVNEAQDLEDWAEEQIDLIDEGEIDTADLHGQAYNAKQLKQLRRQAKALIRKAQDKATQLAESEQLNEQASQAYAWLNDPESREAQIHAQIMEKQFPELRNNPAGRLAVADMMVGMAARLQGRQATAAQPPAPAPSTGSEQAAPQGGGMGGASASAILAKGSQRRSAAPAPQGGSPAAAPAGNQGDLARSSYANTGDPGDLANLLLGQG